MKDIIIPMKPCKVNKTSKSQMDKLAKIVNNPKYVWETKLDGVSIVGKDKKLFSTKLGKNTGLPAEKTQHLRHISSHMEIHGGDAIIIGEAYRPGLKSNDVVSIINSAPEVAIQKQEERGYLEWHIYDMYQNTQGLWIADLPLHIRRQQLKVWYEDSVQYFTEQDIKIVLVDQFDCSEYNPEEAAMQIIADGGEGVVIKDIMKPALLDKRPMWNQIKIKPEIHDDVFIIGTMPATIEYTGKEEPKYFIEGKPVSKFHYHGWIGAIRIGKYDNDGNIVDVGKVSGLTDEIRASISKNYEDYHLEVIRIKAMEKTEDGYYRHANFVDFHESKNHFECKVEEND